MPDNPPRVPGARCTWCSAPYTPTKRTHACCSPACTNALQNLRKLRGAQAYDMLCMRASSYKHRGLVTELDRMARRWLAEDTAAGRRTWCEDAARRAVDQPRVSGKRRFA